MKEILQQLESSRRFLKEIKYRIKTASPIEEEIKLAFELREKYNLTQDEAENLVNYMSRLDLEARDLQGRIIDIGSGSGSFKKAIEKIAGPQSIVNFEIKLWQKPDIVGRAERMPFRDNSFNLALAAYSVPIIPALQGRMRTVKKIIGEIFRIVKPGGKIKMVPLATWFDEPGSEYEPQLGVGEKEKITIRAVLNKLEEIRGAYPTMKMTITQIKSLMWNHVLNRNAQYTTLLLEIQK